MHTEHCLVLGVHGRLTPSSKWMLPFVAAELSATYVRAMLFFGVIAADVATTATDVAAVVCVCVCVLPHKI